MNWKSIGIEKIGIFALSRQPDERLLETAAARLEREGVAVTLPKRLAPFRTMAGGDAERAASFNEMLADSSIDMLLAACGGFGVTRCLDYLDWELMKHRCIPIVGYSDVTALHLAAYSKGCRLNVCGPMLCKQWNESDDTIFTQNIQSLFQALSGQTLLPSWNGGTPIKEGIASGPVIPANLTLLESLLGTDYMPSLEEAILVLEDVNEPAHAIDRRLSHLKMAHVLEHLSGLVFGQFSDGDDAEFIPDILQEYAMCLQGPAVSGLSFGHIRQSLSLPVGREGRLVVSQDHVRLQ